MKNLRLLVASVFAFFSMMFSLTALLVTIESGSHLGYVYLIALGCAFLTYILVAGD